MGHMLERKSLWCYESDPDRESIPGEEVIGLNLEAIVGVSCVEEGMPG